MGGSRNAHKQDHARHFVWPMLSGALKEDTNFLRLLQSRGRNEPNAHLLQDIERLNLARDFDCLPPNLFVYTMPGWAVHIDADTDKARPFVFEGLNSQFDKKDKLLPSRKELAADIARYAYNCQTHVLKVLVKVCMCLLGRTASGR